jgi:outer membrane protein assembly factor BamB
MLVASLASRSNLIAFDSSQLGFTSSRNNVAPSRDVPATWTSTKLEKWRCGLGTQTNGSPVVAGGKIFIGTNNGGGYLSRFPSDVDLGVLLCIDKTTGGLLWQYCCKKLPTGKVNDWPEVGICSTPLVEGNRLWIVSSRGEVVCLDADGFRDNENDGPKTDEESVGDLEADVIWRLDMMREFGVEQHNMANCSVTTIGNILLVCTSNGIDRAHERVTVPEAPSFLGLDKRTGRLIWKDNSPGTNVLHGQWSSPAVVVTDDATQAVFAGGDGWLYSFDPRGNGKGCAKLLWKFDCNSKVSRWIDGHRGERNNIIATPVVHGQHVYVATGRDPEKPVGRGRLWCIDAATRVDGSDVSEELAFGSAGQLLPHRRTQAIDRSQGETVRANPKAATRWCYTGQDRNNDGKLAPCERMHRTISSVAIDDGLVIAVDISGIIHCLDADSGRAFWTYDSLAEIWASPLIVGDRVIVASGDGVISVFMLSADPQTAMLEADGHLTPILQWDLGGPIHATPTVSEGVLYVATQRNLFALNLCQDPEQRETTSECGSAAITISNAQ